MSQNRDTNIKTVKFSHITITEDAYAVWEEVRVLFAKSGGNSVFSKCSCGVSCGKESSDAKNINAKSGTKK